MTSLYSLFFHKKDIIILPPLIEKLYNTKSIYTCHHSAYLPNMTSPHEVHILQYAIINVIFASSEESNETCLTGIKISKRKYLYF